MPAAISTIVTYNPYTLTRDASLDGLVGLTHDLEVRAWPVIDDDRRVLGLLTEDHIVRAVEHVSRSVGRDAGSRVALGAYSQTLAIDWMDTSPVVFEHGAYQTDALAVLASDPGQAVVVIENGQLIGMITSADVLREFAAGEWPEVRGRVSDVVQPVIDWLDNSASLEDAREEFARHDVDHLGVMRGDMPIGIVSRRELQVTWCWQITRSLLGDSGIFEPPDRIGKLIASAPSVRPGDRLRDVAARLVETRQDAVAVINQAGHLQGAMTAKSILTRLLDIDR